MAWRSGTVPQNEADEPPVNDTTSSSSTTNDNPPPISGSIPSFTGGIHTFQTDNLRHRHTQSGSHDLYSSPQNRYQLTSISLDDADMAAGAAQLSPRHRASTQPMLSASTPRSKSMEGNLLLQRPMSDNFVRQRKSLVRGLSDGAANLFDRAWNVASGELSPPPSLQTMDRGHYRGSESDFLSLNYRPSITDGTDSSISSSEGESLLPKQQLSNRAISYPPFGLPTIDGSPVPTRHAIDQNTLPNLPQITTVQSFIIFGQDISHYTRRSQFLISATGTFTFSLMYGYLQELISVELCHRKLGLFLAAAQFLVYAIFSYFLRGLDKTNAGVATGGDGKKIFHSYKDDKVISVPIEMYLGLSILRAIDLGMTNMAMAYVNYPAKTLMKSTRIVFTMLFGVLVTKKRYGLADYGIVGLMVAGLGIFMHADAKSSAVFQPLGVIMLTISLLCDGAISNVSESIMNRYQVGQDEFIFRLYSVALFFVSIAALFKGDLRDGLVYLTYPGTLKEIEEGLEPTWSVSAKLITLILFSATGYLSSSLSAAITKSFGALTMSITSTARKAATIFLSFALFSHECTLEHVSGIALFIGSLIGKSMRASRHRGHHHHRHHSIAKKEVNHLELGGITASGPTTMATNNRTAAAAIMRRKNVEDVV